MGSLISKDGSFKSVAETVAFPYDQANRYHEKSSLTTFKNIKFNVVGPDSQKVIIFCHGNCATVTDNSNSIQALIARTLHIRVYALEYLGYGEQANAGTPTSESCMDALDKMVEYVHVVKQVPVNNIFIVGQSIGTGVVSQYVSNCQYSFGGIILISPYKSILRVVLPDSVACSSAAFDFNKTCYNILDINIPICLIHGTEDQVIHISHGKEIYNKLVSSGKDVCSTWVTNAGHNDIFQRECFAAMDNFIGHE